MDILSALNQLPSSGLRETELVRLVRMGIHTSTLEGKSELYYQEFMQEYNARNARYLKKSKNNRIEVNIWQAPIQDIQIEHLAYYGFTVDDKARALISDGKARDIIDLIHFAIGDKTFIKCYASWLRDSTKSGQPKFTLKDVEQMKASLIHAQKENANKSVRVSTKESERKQQMTEDEIEEVEPEIEEDCCSIKSAAELEDEEIKREAEAWAPKNLQEAVIQMRNSTLNKKLTREWNQRHSFVQVEQPVPIALKR